MATTTPVELDRSVIAFLQAPRKMLIGGKWVEAASGKTFETENTELRERVSQLERELKALAATAVPSGKAARSKSKTTTK